MKNTLKFVSHICFSFIHSRVHPDIKINEVIQRKMNLNEHQSRKQSEYEWKIKSRMKLQ